MISTINGLSNIPSFHPHLIAYYPFIILIALIGQLRLTIGNLAWPI